MSTRIQKADIKLYINSPGRSVTAGMAIDDTMHNIKPDVPTYPATGLLVLKCAFSFCLGAKKESDLISPTPTFSFTRLWAAPRGKPIEIEIARENIL